MSLEDTFGVPDINIVCCKGIIDAFLIIDGFLKNSIAIVWHFTSTGTVVLSGVTGLNVVKDVNLAT